ncbi:hypothetical protein ACFSSA_05375 [Luteolibacter algae]|uniref:VanZ-like domain-containing protein n=1 Tax=Luteolibacter algae TaxID=454151 RepID=A0ABW5D916_9BACT
MESKHGGGRLMIYRLMMWVGVLAVVVLLGAVFYFSWIPNPRLGELGWMPEGLGDVVDRFSRLRTGVPFVGLGLVTGFFLRRKRRPLGDWGLVFLFLVCVVFTAELGQINLPRRVLDWQDILWGIVGSAVGMIAMWKRPSTR